jgi:hypothetical protein
LNPPGDRAAFSEVECADPHDAVVLEVRTENTFIEDDRDEIETRLLSEGCPEGATDAFSTWYSRDFDVGPWTFEVVCFQRSGPEAG